MSTSPFAERDFLAPLAGDGRPPGVLDVDAPDVGAEDLDGVDRVAHVVEEHVGRVEVDLDVLGDFSSSRVRRSSKADSWPVSKARVTPLSAAIWPALARVSSMRFAAGVADLGQEPGVERQVGQAHRDGPVERPGERSSRSGRVAGSPKPPVAWMDWGVV